MNYINTQKCPTPHKMCWNRTKKVNYKINVTTTKTPKQHGKEEKDTTKRSLI